MEKDQGLGVPKAGETFHCHACGMELKITKDCKCSAGEKVHFHCCGKEMHKAGKGER